MAGKKTIGSLLVRLGMDPRDADNAIKKFEKDMRAMGKRMESVGRAMSIGFTAPFLLAIGKSIKAYDEEAQVTRKLQIALGGTSKALLDQAAALQKVTTFADDEIITQQAWAAALGHSEGQIKDMTDAAVGLAAGLGIGLDEAMKGLHQTTMGQTKTLGKLIPGIKEMTQEQLKSGAAIDLVKEKFAGYAEAMALTGAGPLKVLKNQLGDLSEQMGQAVLPIVVALSEKIKELISWFQNLSPEVKQSVVGWGLLVAAIGPMLLILPKVVTLFTVMFSEVGLISLAIVGLAGAIAYVVKNWEALKYNVGTTIDNIGNALTFGVHRKDTKPNSSWGDEPGQARGMMQTQSFGEFMKSVGTDITNALGFGDGQKMIDDANAKIDALSKSLGKVGQAGHTAAEGLKDYSRVLSDIGQHVTSALVPNRGGGGIPKIAPGNNANPNTVSGSSWANAQQLTPASTWATGTASMLNGMTSSVDDASKSWLNLGDVFSSVMGTMIQGMEAGGESFAQFALSAVAAAAKVIQAALLEIAVETVKAHAAIPGGIIIGLAAATVGLTALNALMKSIKPPALAGGGVTSGATMAMIGDNPSGKEMVMPWEKTGDFANKIASQIGGAGGHVIEVVGRIRGDDILLQTSRAQGRAIRRGSANIITF